MDVVVAEAVDTRRIRVRLALVAWSHPCRRTEAALRGLTREQAEAEAHLARVAAEWDGWDDNQRAAAMGR